MATKKASKKSSKKAGRRPTGSQKMSAAKGGSGAATQGPLHRALAALDKGGIQHKILIKGIPFPDIIRGKLSARGPREASAALGILLNVQNMQYKPVKLFPKGIPVIDHVVMEIDGKLKH